MIGVAEMLSARRIGSMLFLMMLYKAHLVQRQLVIRMRLRLVEPSLLGRHIDDYASGTTSLTAKIALDCKHSN